MQNSSTNEAMPEGRGALAFARFLPAALLASAVLISSGRGLDLTDESYYLLNYLYWRDSVALRSFFGAYFEAPFRLMGESIVAIRIFGLLLLVSAAGFFFHRLTRFYRAKFGGVDLNRFSVITVGMACVLTYFSFLTTLRSPSYNLLTLACMLVSTALLLGYLEGRWTGKSQRIAYLAYGFVLSVCVLTKITAATALAFSHGALFLVFNRVWRIPSFFTMLAFILAGFSVNLLLLQLMFPGWLEALINGVAYGALLEVRDLPKMLTIQLRWEMQKAAAASLPTFLPILLVHPLLIVTAGRKHRWTIALIVPLVIAVGVVQQLVLFQTGSTWLISVLTAWLLWSTEFLLRRQRRLVREDALVFGLLAFLFALPIAYSFGTNLSIPFHSNMAGIFSFAACLLLVYRLRSLRSIGSLSFLASITILCVPAVMLQILPWIDQAHTYRSRTALADQNVPLATGGHVLDVSVDRTTRDDLAQFADALRSAGFKPGDPVLDFTGDGNGLMYTVGGKPVGVPWIAGGYSGSDVGARFILAKVDAALLGRSWIIASNGGPRRISNWQKMLSERIGINSHSQVAEILFHAPYGWGQTDHQTFTLSVWKPRAAP